MPYGGTPNNPAYASYPQPYGQAPGSFAPAQAPFAQQQAGYGSPVNQPYPGAQQFPPTPQFLPPTAQAFSPPYQAMPPHLAGPARPFGATSPPIPFQQGQYQPPRMHTPPQNLPPPQRSGSLPAAPGLPQRPSFGAPPVNAFQMQQMHQGQIHGPPNSTPSIGAQNLPAQQAGWMPAQNGNNEYVTRNATDVAAPPPPANVTLNETSITATSLDDLVAGAAKDANKTDNKAEAPAAEKKAKKDKDKPVKLVYSDNEMSPEEKMAKMPRYAFVPDQKPETVLGEATTAAVTGVAVGVDDVLDRTG